LKEPSIHPTSIVDTQHIGQKTRIWAFANIMKDVHIGADCNIGSHCFIESGAMIGNNVIIKNGSMIWEGVTLDDGVFVGPGVLFTNDRHPRSRLLPQARRRYDTQGWPLPTLVRRGASIGAGAIIIAGITIGEFAMVGAGAVVTYDVPPYALVTGSPARVQGWVCGCGQPLKFQEGLATCIDCGLRYLKEGGSVSLTTSL